MINTFVCIEEAAYSRGKIVGLSDLVGADLVGA